MLEKLIEKALLAGIVGIALPIALLLAILIYTWWTHPERPSYSLRVLAILELCRSFFTRDRA